MTTTDPAPRLLPQPPRVTLPGNSPNSFSGWRLSPGDVTNAMPLLVAVAVLCGLVFAVAVTPIGSGDYGQWLMTSRRFLGESVPAYRNLSGVPPLVPALLAGIQLVVPDPMVALHVLATVLLIGLGSAFFTIGAVGLGNRWCGALSIVIGLLVTDRFMDLFAFGAMLQIPALTFGCLAIAAILRAAHDPIRNRRWLLCSAGALGLAAITHVGTATLMVPIGLSLAALVALGPLVRAQGDHRPVVRRLLIPGLAFAAVGAYWLVVLVPASADYVANPASLAYRGPERLWADLFGRWPTAVVAMVGAAALVVTATSAARRRRLEPMLLVAVWAMLAWGLLAWSLMSGSATDYPRFATPVLLPLVIGAAAAVLWVLRALTAVLGGEGYRAPSALIAVVVVLAVLVAAPLTVNGYVNRAVFYELRDAAALADASAWLEAELPEGATVLADVREGKWIEGLSGHPALFAQSVRYAFRPDEWQRSADADALLRSTLTLTSGYISAQFVNRAGSTGATVPTDMLIRANHRGEFLDLLRLRPADVRIGRVRGYSLLPVRATHIVRADEVALRTVWGISGNPDFSFTQTATVFEDGTTLRILASATSRRVAAILTPSVGIHITSLAFAGDQASACFSERAGSAPCLRFHVADGGRLIDDGNGGIRIRGNRTGVIDVLVTALTAGNPSVGLGLLDPARVAADHDVRAAVLNASDPAYLGRLARLEALGFREGRRFGTYAVLIRPAEALP
jgi:hypothetical protein